LANNTFFTLLSLTKQFVLLSSVSRLLPWWCVSLFFFPFFLCVSLFYPFFWILLSLNFIWFSQTSLGDNVLRIIFLSLCMNEILFMNPSWITLVSYCHGLPNRIWLASIWTTSHSTLLVYCPMERHTFTWLFTTNSPSSLSHWRLYGLGCGLVSKFNLDTNLELAALVQLPLWTIKEHKFALI